MCGLCIIFPPPLLHQSIRAKAIRAFEVQHSCISLGKGRGCIKDMFNLKKFNEFTSEFF